MAFLASLLQYAVKVVLFAAVAAAGIFLEEAARQEKRLDGTAQEEKLTLEESCCEEIWSK